METVHLLRRGETLFRHNADKSNRYAVQFRHNRHFGKDQTTSATTKTIKGFYVQVSQ